MVLKMTSSCGLLGTWNTLVSYSTRSLRNGLSLRPGTHSPRSKAIAGDLARISERRQDSRAAATRPADHLCTSASSVESAETGSDRRPAARDAQAHGAQRIVQEPKAGRKSD